MSNLAEQEEQYKCPDTESHHTYWNNVCKNNVNIFEMTRAADYFDIDLISQSLVEWFARKIYENNFLHIHERVYSNCINLPHGFSGRVLYKTLEKKYKNDIQVFDFAQWGLLHDILVKYNTTNSQENFEYNDFCFLKKTVGNFVYFSGDDVLLKNSLSYPRIRINSNATKNLLRTTMERYVNKRHMSDAVISGGIFYDYQPDCLFAEKFPALFERLSQNQDIDIFFLDTNGDKFTYYYDKYQSTRVIIRRSLDINTDSDEVYENVHSFKIRSVDGKNINYIFIDLKLEGLSLITFLESFDFSISKTFYRYDSDQIFFPVEIFNNYENLCLKHGIVRKCEDIVSILEETSKFDKYLKALDVLFKTVKENNYLTARHIFLNKHHAELKLICRSRKMFIRCLKYGFKNYFKGDSQEKLALDKLGSYYRVFHAQILDNNFSFMNVIESIIYS